jgi:hypothetical protein
MERRSPSREYGHEESIANRFKFKEGPSLQLVLAPYLAQNQPLGATIIAVVLIAPLITYVLARKRKNRIKLTAMVSLALLFATILVPVIPLGGANICHYSTCHNEQTYGSLSWLFVCAGAEYTTPPGGVSTGLPIFPINVNSTLGDYFFAQCAFL